MFQIDALSRTPVYLQLVEQTERLILSGVLTPGQQMPSVRNLSIALSVNPNTIQKAYSELDSHGLTCAVPAADVLSPQQRRGFCCSRPAGSSRSFFLWYRS